MGDLIDKVLQSRRAAAEAAAATQAPSPTPASSAETTEAGFAAPQEVEGDKFFSILLGENGQEHFLELQFRDGLRTCFSYTDLQWFNYDPAGTIDLEFGGFLITVEGRGLGGRLWSGLKQKRVGWIREADTPRQDHSGNETFIDRIILTPPKAEGEAAESSVDGALEAAS